MLQDSFNPNFGKIVKVHVTQAKLETYLVDLARNCISPSKLGAIQLKILEI